MRRIGPGVRSPMLPAVLWALVVGVLLLLPADALPPAPGWLPLSLDEWIDKLAHLTVFLVLVLLVRRALASRVRAVRPRLVAVALTLAYAVILEAIQPLVPGREWQTGDLVAALLGVLLALALVPD